MSQQGLWARVSSFNHVVRSRGAKVYGMLNSIGFYTVEELETQLRSRNIAQSDAPRANHGVEIRKGTTEC